MAPMTTPASKSSGFIGPSKASQIQSSLTGPDFGVVDSVSGRTMDNLKGILLNTYTHPTKSVWIFLNLLIMVIALQFLNYSCHPTVFMSRGLSSVSIVVLLTARPTCLIQIVPRPFYAAMPSCLVMGHMIESLDSIFCWLKSQQLY